MSITLTATCPYCRTKNAGFAFKGEAPHPAGSKGHGHLFEVLFTCNGCHGGVVLRARTRGSYSSLTQLKGEITQQLGNSQSDYSIEPKLQVATIPEGLSQTVARCFRQAKESAALAHNDAAGSMFRKALDVATVELDPSLSPLKLVRRIDSLADRHLITPALREWAHEVRLDGNEAAHEPDEPTSEEIGQLGEFTEMFLVYAFTMPGRVAARRTQRDS